MNSSRGLSVGTGIVFAVIGIIFLVFPAFTMSFFATLVGFGMLVAGISSLVVWFNDLRGTGTGGGMLFIGVICVIIAAVCFLHPLALAETVTWLVALAVVVSGIAQICGLVAMGSVPGRAVGIIGSAVVVLFGVLALAWPQLIIQFIGISLLIEGIMIFVMSAFSQQR